MLSVFVFDHYSDVHVVNISQRSLSYEHTLVKCKQDSLKIESARGNACISMKQNFRRASNQYVHNTLHCNGLRAQFVLFHVMFVNTTYFTYSSSALCSIISSNKYEILQYFLLELYYSLVPEAVQ